MTTQAITFQPPIPILRIFSIPKANEFYIDYLGFKIDWDHRFDDDDDNDGKDNNNDNANNNTSPLYRQISRSNLTLHLSEHHGDSCPGMRIRIPVTNIVAFHAELKGKNYTYMRPGLEDGVVEGQWEMEVVDPFGNRLCFCGEKEKEGRGEGGG